MKRFALYIAALFAASLIQAQVQPAAKATDTATPAAKATDTAVTQSKPGVATPAKKVEKKVEEPKIPGVTIPRANGTFLGLEVADAKFKLTFYDKKKKKMAVDVTRATARWPNTRSATVAFNFTVLNPSGPNSLLAQKPALPPYAWNVTITLLQGEGDTAKAVETFTMGFHG